MSLILNSRGVGSGVAVAVLVLWLARPAAVADEKDKAKSPAKGPPSADEKAPPKEPDPFVVPDGTPEELLQYIKRLYAGRPSGDSGPSWRSSARRASKPCWRLRKNCLRPS